MTPQRKDAETPPVDRDDLIRVFERLLGTTVSKLRATALGASSRETPWRIDLSTSRGSLTFLCRFGGSCSRNEAVALEAMASHPLPTPTVLRWDPDGTDLGTPLFVSTFIEGASLLDAMKAGEVWADALYAETVCAVQSIERSDLPAAAAILDGGESADAVLEAAYAAYEKPNPLAEAAYVRLRETRPALPPDRFSNGDLWPENLLVRGTELVGIIDWQHAGFGDPIYEFLLPFFLVPELRGRGTEEAYCRRLGYDPALLDWYHGLEFFDSWRWVLKLGEPYMIHTAESLEADLSRWLDEVGPRLG